MAAAPGRTEHAPGRTTNALLLAQTAPQWGRGRTPPRATLAAKGQTDQTKWLPCTACDLVSVVGRPANVALSGPAPQAHRTTSPIQSRHRHRHTAARSQPLHANRNSSTFTQCSKITEHVWCACVYNGHGQWYLAVDSVRHLRCQQGFQCQDRAINPFMPLFHVMGNLTDGQCILAVVQYGLLFSCAVFGLLSLPVEA